MLNKQNKTIMKKSLLLAAASLAVISCSKREIGTFEGNDDPSVVRFSSTTGEVGTKVTVDNNGHSTFEAGDVIGIYAVNHGKKLGDTPGTTQGSTEGVFPGNSDLQYLNKKYKVTSVTPYNTGTNAAAIAAFDTVGGTPSNQIFYQSGGKGWNYYAYYPTSDLTDATDFVMMNGVAQTTTFAITNPQLNFMNQVNLKGNDIESGQTAVAYPGPIMFAYYKTEDKAPAAGTAKTPVQLDFKYANAKLTVNFEMKGNAGKVSDIKSVILYGTGMKGGFVFDLAKAKNIYETIPVNDVLTTNASGTALDGSGINNGAVIGGNTKAYVFGKKITLAQSNKDKYAANNSWTPGAGEGTITDDSTLCKTTGYLIPCAAITNAKIEIRIGDYPNQQVRVAKLDETEGGTITNVTDVTTGNTRAAVNHLAKIEPGKEYRFNVVLSSSNVNFTGTIEDWTVVTAPNVIPAE